MPCDEQRAPWTPSESDRFSRGPTLAIRTPASLMPARAGSPRTAGHRPARSRLKVTWSAHQRADVVLDEGREGGEARLAGGALGRVVNALWLGVGGLGGRQRSREEGGGPCGGGGGAWAWPGNGFVWISPSAASQRAEADVRQSWRMRAAPGAAPASDEPSDPGVEGGAAHREVVRGRRTSAGSGWRRRRPGPRCRGSCSPRARRSASRRGARWPGRR